MGASVEQGELPRPCTGKEQLPNLCTRGQSSSRMQAPMVTEELSKEEMVGCRTPKMHQEHATCSMDSLSAIFTPTDHLPPSMGPPSTTTTASAH